MNVKKLFGTSLLLLCLIALSALFYSNNVNAQLMQPKAAPEFTHTQASEWLNSQPLQLSDLKGKVVLLDVWTFGCWNCYRSFPWLNKLERDFAEQGLQVIGIHSPEFDHEHDRDKVAAKIKEFKLTHPVMLDNDFSYWKALDNRYWPTYYLIDKKGQLRARFIGETHEGDRNAVAVEKIMKALLAE